MITIPFLAAGMIKIPIKTNHFYFVILKITKKIIRNSLWYNSTHRWKSKEFNAPSWSFTLNQNNVLTLTHCSKTKPTEFLCVLFSLVTFHHDRTPRSLILRTITQSYKSEKERDTHAHTAHIRNISTYRYIFVTKVFYPGMVIVVLDYSHTNIHTYIQR